MFALYHRFKIRYTRFKRIQCTMQPKSKIVLSTLDREKEECFMHRYFAVIIVCLFMLMQCNQAYAQKKSKTKVTPSSNSQSKSPAPASSISGQAQKDKAGQIKVAPELKPGPLLDSAQLLIQPTFTSLLDALPRAEKVYKLRLDENNLTTLPATIGQLVNLQELSLDRNLLTTLPPEIGKLTNLQVLVLDKNKIKRLPREIMNLRNLQKLYLNNYNQIEESDDTTPGEELRMLWAGIDSLTKLETLGLGGNKFKEVPPAIAKIKSSIRHLYINDNNLSELPSSIASLEHLEHLDVSNNQLKALPEVIGRLKTLQILDCRLNSLLKVPTEIGGCAGLIELDLGFNLLKELPDEIGNLKNLEKVNISNNRLTTLPATIEKWEKLKKLKMTDNSFKDDAYISALCRKLPRKASIDRDIKK